VAATFESGPFGAGTLLYQVPDPERFGVAELDADGRVVAFEEKPDKPKSDLIPIGVYFLRPDAFDVIGHLLPSGRGELEITDVLNHYIPSGGLYSPTYEGHWTDAGTVPSLLRAAELAAADDEAGRLPPPVSRLVG
jgi:glucose-1-phosphate thymidylyltransferase